MSIPPFGLPDPELSREPPASRSQDGELRLRPELRGIRAAFIFLTRLPLGGFPYSAAERGYVDSVIMPSETRTSVIKALRALRGKRKQLPPKKHGNIPL